MSLLSFLLGPTKFPFRKSFLIPKGDYQFIEGDAIKICNKPNTDTINFYVKGSFEGDGLISSLDNKTTSSYLKNPAVNVNCGVLKVTKNSILTGVIITKKNK